MIRAFPSLRLYKGGQPLSPDYREDRTVEALTVRPLVTCTAIFSTHTRHGAHYTQAPSRCTRVSKYSHFLACLVCLLDMQGYVERTLDLHAKIAESSDEHRQTMEKQLFQDKDFPGKE